MTCPIHPILNRLTVFCFVLIGASFFADQGIAQHSTFELKLRKRIESSEGSRKFHAATTEETWQANETAIIVCDMWDAHHCYNAVQRVGKLAKPIDRVIEKARKKGAVIIHAPSSCMEFYADHPARQRAKETPKADNVPKGIENWCDHIPEEDGGKYPIDQSDGGEDDDPEQHQKWAKELEARGLNPRAPWKRQINTIRIDDEKDYVTFDGPEIWSILEKHSAQNVILLGVHTNMCVLGRPFGLRQMAKNGKNVVLMRDLTDAMYNPAAWPYVNHHTGTDLIVEHIEKWVCPTITSDQILGGVPFRFTEDQRKHIAIVIAENEYETDRTIPEWVANSGLGKNYKVSVVFGSDKERNDIPGLEIVNEADILMMSIRRRTLPENQLKLFRDFEASGKPMIGIRTSSHPFCLRKKPAPDGLAEWKEFDAEVWGGHYTNHSKNGIEYRLTTKAVDHPILNGIELVKLRGHHSLYNVKPLAESTKVVIKGTIDGDNPVTEPVAWLNQRKNGGWSFYTSLGHKDDFAQEDFGKLLVQAIDFVAQKQVK